MNIMYLVFNGLKRMKKYFDFRTKEMTILLMNSISNSQLSCKSFISSYFQTIIVVICICIFYVIQQSENIVNKCFVIFQFLMVFLKISQKNSYFHSKYFSTIFLLFLIINFSLLKNNLGLIIELTSLIAFHKELTSIYILAIFNLLNFRPLLDEYSAILLTLIFGLNFLYNAQKSIEIQNKETKLKSVEIIDSNINIVLQCKEEKNSNSYFAGIVHDLRNPVGAVTNTFESLMESSRINDDERKSIESALFCCKIQLMLINNLLDMSKMQANRFELNEEEFNLPMLIYRVIKTEEQFCQRKKLNLKRNIINTLPRIVIGDQNRISQILFNIIGNSIKFTSQGFIKISCAWLKNWDSIDVSDQSMKASLFIKRKRNVISLNLTNLKKATSLNQLDEFSPVGDEVFDDSSIQQNISKYYFNTKSLNSKDKFLKSSRGKNIPSDISTPDAYSNNENALLLQRKIVPSHTPCCGFQNKSYEVNKTFDKKIRDFFDASDINLYSNDGILYIEIVDTGEGIKQEEQASLFKPFSQASSKAKSLGTGLGLWISMKLVEQMGGIMKMYSEYERGTVTKIAIPLKIIKFNTLIFFEEPGREIMNLGVDSKASPEAQRHAETPSHSFQVFIFADSVNFLKKLFPLESIFKENYSQVFFFFNEFSSPKKINYDYNNISKRSIFLFIISEDSEMAIDEISKIQSSDLKFQVTVSKEIYCLVSKDN